MLEAFGEKNLKEFMFSSAMRADQSENGENSTNSVRAQDDGAAINTISGMFVTPEELTLTLTPLLCGHNPRRPVCVQKSAILKFPLIFFNVTQNKNTF